MSQSDKELIDLIRTTIGDQAADLVASRFDSARKYLEVIDRPEVWKTQLLSDVITAAGLVRHGRQCKGLAERIADGAFQWNTELFEASRCIAELEQVSAAGVKDAEDAARWRQTLMYVGGERMRPHRYPDIFILTVQPVEGANIMKGSVAQHFTKAIDFQIAMAKGVQS
jgi:hypothetical protein